MANQPDHLRPWSTVDDEELKVLRTIAKLAARGNLTVAGDVAFQWHLKFEKKQ